MSVFSTELNVVDANIATPTEEAMEQGDPPRVEIELIVGQVLPFPHPDGSGPLMIAIGNVSFPFGKEKAIAFFKNGLAAAESLPDPKPKSNIEVATSMSGVDKVASQISQIKGDG